VEIGFVILHSLSNAVLVSWLTLSEVNNDHFELARDGVRIANIPGQGNSTTGHFYSYTDQTALNGTTYTYTLSAVDTSGSPQVVFSDTATAGILIVEMGSVALIPLDNAVRMVWTTLSETGNDHFEIARDGVRIASIEGQGNSTTAHDYAYTDEDVENGRTYTYTLSAVDLNGFAQEVFSDTATPSLEHRPVTEYALHQNYPNPVEDSTKIAFDLVEDNPVLLKLFDVAGAEIATLVNAMYVAGRYTLTLYTSTLANGLYEYQIEFGDVYQAEKTLLKNTTDYQSLRSAPGVDMTDNSGHFEFDPSEGDTIMLYDGMVRYMGMRILDRAKIVALKSGYAPADTTVSLAGNAPHSLTFVLSALR
jgi:hypothetical protein